jgi:hypothetical protein
LYAFAKSIRKANHVRRYIIQPAPVGWEVREEQDSQVVRQVRYQDWHRVERARRAFVVEMSQLQENGWQEDREVGMPPVQNDRAAPA